jgi:hypothetical protein
MSSKSKLFLSIAAVSCHNRQGRQRAPLLNNTNRRISFGFYPMGHISGVIFQSFGQFRFYCDDCSCISVFFSLSICFNSLNRPAASRILENSIQNACTSINISFMSNKELFIRARRKTQTKRTKRPC